MEKAFELQNQARQNVKTLQTYLTDLQNWEVEMKRKEAALKGEFEQDLPPVRSKIKKEKPVQCKKKTERRIAASDYSAWDKFDVDSACEQVDMEDVGPPSLDSKHSQKAKDEKLREEALYEKEKGNTFVKAEKWDEAIQCYSRAIELVEDDAIFYANRGLCYLKKDSLQRCEADCSAALRLDPSYVKALQRRAAARERLGSLRAASRDLQLVLQLEPRNTQARAQLLALTARMGTKGSKSKSSPTSTPTVESRPLISTPSSNSQPKIIELADEPSTEQKQPSALEQWARGEGEAITVITPVKKPPHLRSKRSLKSIPIEEIPLGSTTPEKTATRLKIVEIEDDLARGDDNNNSSRLARGTDDVAGDLKREARGEGDNVSSPESLKLISDSLCSEKVSLQHLTPPASSVQFLGQWGALRGDRRARRHYLSIINPANLPSIFSNALESGVLSEVLDTLAGEEPGQGADPGGLSVSGYLRALSRVPRFPALVMFLSADDKLNLKTLLHHSREVEKCTEEEILELRNKYEL